MQFENTVTIVEWDGTESEVAFCYLEESNEFAITYPDGTCHIVTDEYFVGLQKT